jgi:hypothetical protein
MEVARTHQDQLARIKKSVRIAHDYFKPNYDRYNDFRRFVFESSLTNDEITLLTTISKPQLEFNILEAYISRLLGEFSKQEPDIEVCADDQNTADPMTIKVVEQHLRHTLTDASNHHTKYEVYKDLLSGGFSTLKVTTDYASPMSMHQVINVVRAEPTLCGFDPLARESHKGDGRLAFELFPMAKDDFEEEYPDVPLQDITFKRDFAGFNWAYLNDSTPMLIVADYYEKKKHETQIVMVRDGRVMKKSEYDKMLKTWSEFSAPPAIVGRPRKTLLETIVRYRLIDNKILKYEETDFAHFPLIFVDGHSVMIRSPKSSNIRQVTRPYVYHAKGAQRLKNYAGISLAGSVENIVEHKFIIKKEALPKEEEYLAAIKDVQKPSNVVVNAYYEENPDQPIPEPIREIAKVPAPPEIVQAFQGSDSLIQNILGSYDASLGINNNQLSGIAIVEAATQSNSAAMPYIVGYLQGYQRAAQIYVDLMPKYYTTPRTIPVMDEEGKKSYVKINGEEGVNMFYDSNALNVLVKAGASFQVQKARTIMMLKEMMGMSQLFAQFIAEKGLNFVLDNMEGRGIDQLKKMVDSWTEELAEQKRLAMEKQKAEMNNNPLAERNQLAAAKLKQDQEKMKVQYMVDMRKIENEEKKIAADMQMAHGYNLVEIVKANTDRFSKRVDLELKRRDMRHRHTKEVIETHHQVTQPRREGAH